jgi:hypothetical protein
MATFPTRENDVMALADDLIKGLTREAEIFPSPPSSAQELQAFNPFGPGVVTRVLPSVVLLAAALTAATCGQAQGGHASRQIQSCRHAGTDQTRNR